MCNVSRGRASLCNFQCDLVFPKYYRRWVQTYPTFLVGGSWWYKTNFMFTCEGSPTSTCFSTAVKECRCFMHMSYILQGFFDLHNLLAIWKAPNQPVPQPSPPFFQRVQKTKRVVIPVTCDVGIRPVVPYRLEWGYGALSRWPYKWVIGVIKPPKFNSKRLWRMVAKGDYIDPVVFWVLVTFQRWFVSFGEGNGVATCKGWFQTPKTWGNWTQPFWRIWETDGWQKNTN